MESTFKALVVSQEPDGTFTRKIVFRDISELPPGDLLIQVSYSSLNYKDALAATGRRGVAHGYPLTPGIDAAGTVVESATGSHAPGETVIVCGHDLGVSVSGGFGQYIRVPAAWTLRPPEGLSLRDCMIVGTAGFTAAQCVRTLQEYGVSPGTGDVLVTGATGGVGSFSVALLSKLGYAVFAGTGKPDQREFLLSLGAREVVPRAELAQDSAKALLKERWAGVIDTVGGNILATAIKSTGYGGVVTACGNAASADLPLTVFPFILRGVRLLGIESSRCPEPVRQELWGKLAGSWRPARLQSMAAECSLQELNGKIDAILQGRIAGRVVVNLQSI